VNALHDLLPDLRADGTSRQKVFGACNEQFAIRQYFSPKRHLLRALLYRKQLAARFAARRKFADMTQNPSFAF
jgi:hypothetical protein